MVEHLRLTLHTHLWSAKHLSTAREEARFVSVYSVCFYDLLQYVVSKRQSIQ